MGGTALAESLATSPAVIHACYAKSNCALRIIHPASGFDGTQMWVTNFTGNSVTNLWTK